MKTKLMLLFVALLIAGSIQAQSVVFCENVTSDGYAETASTVFNIQPEGGSLKILTKMDETLDAYEVNYEVYLADPNGEEKYETTISQATQPDWTWFWKEIIFYKPGRYNVYVKTAGGRFIGSGQVIIQYY